MVYKVMCEGTSPRAHSPSPPLASTPVVRSRATRLPSRGLGAPQGMLGEAGRRGGAGALGALARGADCGPKNGVFSIPAREQCFLFK